MTIKISSIHFCPVKSVSYQTVDHCNVHKDIGLEGDRVFAFLKNLEADDPTLIDKETNNVSCYDPSSGSGTLLINLAHQIGEEKCTINSQDISQKSTQLLRLNLILNNLVHSIPNVIQGNVITDPYHKDKNYNLKKFDYIVSNPPFKLDFSDYRDNLDTKENKDRFFAGIPNIPPKEKDTMAIYLLFIQHIVSSLNVNGKAAIVVPTGFLTAKSLAKKIREKIVKDKI
ncbi:N-6 DNA methylase, partial [Candidatus Pelagibacter sp.]|nr:N-6 DNA methylase [Candidatus Pelagibacter sp.]